MKSTNGHGRVSLLCAVFVAGFQSGCLDSHGHTSCPVAADASDDASVQDHVPVCTFIETRDQILDAPGLCFPRSIEVGVDGSIDCNVVWILPSPEFAGAGTPTQCSEHPSTFAPPLDRAQRTADGRAICLVNQLIATSCSGGAGCMCLGGGGPECDVQGIRIEEGEGWFWDTFSPSATECLAGAHQRVAYTANSHPPSGVDAFLVCPTVPALVCK